MMSTFDWTYFRGALGSVQDTYKGYAIKVSQILGSGQRLYTVAGLGGEYSLFDYAHDAIDKYLGEYVAPPVRPVTEMSEEMFAQLQAGTLALQENVRLQSIIDNAVQSIDTIRTTQLPEISGLTQSVDKIRNSIDKINEMREDTVGMIETLNTQVTDKLKSITDIINQTGATIRGTTEQIEDVTGTLGDINETIKGVTETMLGIPDSIADIVSAYEKALAAKGATGWLKNIPLYVGAGLAVVIGVKVLDVVD